MRIWKGDWIMKPSWSMWGGVDCVGMKHRPGFTKHRFAYSGLLDSLDKYHYKLLNCNTYGCGLFFFYFLFTLPTRLLLSLPSVVETQEERCRVNDQAGLFSVNWLQTNHTLTRGTIAEWTRCAWGLLGFAWKPNTHWYRGGPHTCVRVRAHTQLALMSEGQQNRRALTTGEMWLYWVASFISYLIGIRNQWAVQSEYY